MESHPKRQLWGKKDITEPLGRLIGRDLKMPTVCRPWRKGAKEIPPCVYFLALIPGSARILTAAVTSRLPRSELDLTGERS